MVSIGNKSLYMETYSIHKFSRVWALLGKIFLTLYFSLIIKVLVVGIIKICLQSNSNPQEFF